MLFLILSLTQFPRFLYCLLRFLWPIVAELVHKGGGRDAWKTGDFFGWRGPTQGGEPAPFFCSAAPLGTSLVGSWGVKVMGDADHPSPDFGKGWCDALQPTTSSQTRIIFPALSWRWQKNHIFSWVSHVCTLQFSSDFSFFSPTELMVFFRNSRLKLSQVFFSQTENLKAQIWRRCWEECFIPSKMDFFVQHKIQILWNFSKKCWVHLLNYRG